MTTISWIDDAGRLAEPAAIDREISGLEHRQDEIRAELDDIVNRYPQAKALPRHRGGPGGVGVGPILGRPAARGWARTATVNTTLHPLRAIFRRALARGELAVNPCAGLELPTDRARRERFASPTEADALMIGARVNPKALQTFMGHASITVTLDTYGHLFPGSEAEARSLSLPPLADPGGRHRRCRLAAGLPVHRSSWG